MYPINNAINMYIPKVLNIAIIDPTSVVNISNIPSVGVIYLPPFFSFTP